MHSVNIDRGLSPKKRSLSRGMSEDESLRSIIKETETPSRRLTRSDSRGDTLKRTTRRDSQQSDQDLYLGLPDMLDLQASYDEVVQELRGMEVERETLLFQVDVLQDTLEGVEELLAEAQREAGQASLELERERDARRKVEAMMHTLMEEMERMKEERNATPAAPVNTVSREEEMMGEVQQTAAASSVRSGPPACSSSASSLVESDDAGKGEREAEGKPSSPTKLQRMARGGKSFEQTATLALDSQLTEEDGVLRRPWGEGLATETGDNDTDSISTYEDACAETPELDRMFPPPSNPSEVADPFDDDGDVTVTEKNGGPGSPNNDSDETANTKNPNDSCVVS